MTKTQMKADNRASYRAHFSKRRGRGGGSRTKTRPGYWFETTVDGKVRKVSSPEHGRRVQLAAAKRRACAA